MNWSNWHGDLLPVGGGSGLSEDNCASLGGHNSLLLAFRYLVSVATATELNVRPLYILYTTILRILVPLFPFLLSIEP